MGMPIGPDLATAIEMCHADGKPLMVAETGIMADGTSHLASRATEFKAKFSTQFNAGAVGELMWAWTPAPNFVYPEHDPDYGVFPGDPSLGVLLTFSKSITSATTSSTTSASHPMLSINGVVVTLGSRIDIVTTVKCVDSRCSGMLEPTKTISTKVERGHSKRYAIRRTVLVLGKVRYAVAKGSQRQFSIRLNAAGVKLLNAAKGRRVKCDLKVTSAAGVKRESISLRIP
jgi:hypothetical protein